MISNPQSHVVLDAGKADFFQNQLDMAEAAGLRYLGENEALEESLPDLPAISSNESAGVLLSADDDGPFLDVIPQNPEAWELIPSVDIWADKSANVQDSPPDFDDRTLHLNYVGSPAGPDFGDLVGDLVPDAALNAYDLIDGRGDVSDLLHRAHLKQAYYAYGSSHPDHSYQGEADITFLDVSYDARGGSGGGGSGGGGGSSGVPTDYFAGSADGITGYDIWIQFKGTEWTLDLQQAFKNAADYFTTVIKDDIGGGGLYRGKTIDDVYITAELKAIDGSGGVLGQAGPTAIWSATDLTAAGQMQFDTADARNFFNLGLWDEIVTHEMMHVLGFGSLWNYNSHSLVLDYQYTGANALVAYQAVYSGATYIPVESTGGAGTAGAHWDEQLLSNELMTGYLDPSNNYLSKFSVMSLADLGYTVNYSDYPYDTVLIA